uniref:Uncharacterized protein n=1 Tax=Glossina austeni TaxID=7395 RepID=A0A1A9UM53_GLOAU
MHLCVLCKRYIASAGVADDGFEIFGYHIFGIICIDLQFQALFITSRSTFQRMKIAYGKFWLHETLVLTYSVNMSSVNGYRRLNSLASKCDKRDVVQTAIIGYYQKHNNPPAATVTCHQQRNTRMLDFSAKG